MFGACLSGRPVQMASQVSDMKYVIKFNNIPSTKVSHVSIFMLPNVQFDSNYTALVYIQIESNDLDSNLPPQFKLLGGLNVNKQSAIYKINALNSIPSTKETQFDDADMDMDVENENSSGSSENISIGISIEPNATAQEQLDQMRQNMQLVRPTVVPQNNNGQMPVGNIDHNYLANLSNKIISNAYNFLSGFVDDQNNVPISRFDDWWTKFKGKVANDPKFLDNMV
ncbi:hypothetical protein B5S28_g2844 [[Candida] boidinii]|nr:hypothetical protein B5S28_g2844 [[Candida] boidinii]OWB70782.1 hypothetical protein B5S31_g461 [[Candida] boidinii]